MLGRHSPPPRARNCVGGVRRCSVATPRARSRVGSVRRCSVATPRARSRVGVPRRSATTHLRTSYTPLARNRVGGAPRLSAATHHPSRSQSRGGCAAMFGHYPPLALAVAWGVYHDVRPLLTTLRARNRVGGVPRCSFAAHPLHPSRSQLRGGCTTTFGRHSPPLALAIAWGV
jgi:hypothetical protein